MTLSDRIAVMYEGRIVGEVDAATAAVEEIGLMMAGGREAMTIRIERRLTQPHWLKVAVPLGSLVVAFLLIAILLARHRPRPRRDLQGSLRGGVHRPRGALADPDRGDAARSSPASPPPPRSG